MHEQAESDFFSYYLFSNLNLRRVAIIFILGVHINYQIIVPYFRKKLLFLLRIEIL